MEKSSKYLLSKKFIHSDKIYYLLKKSQEERIKIIKSKRYNYVNTNCGICLSSKKMIISERDKYGFLVEFSICKNCGHVYQSYRLSDKSLNQFYIEDFVKLDSGYLESQEIIFEDLKKRIETSVFPIIKNTLDFNKKLNILEIGCSNGGGLSFFDNLGHNTKGIDIEENSIEFGKNKGLDLELVDIENFNPKNKFDLIYLISVFEHLTDLHLVLNKIRKLINKNGCLFIKVPGLMNIHNNSFHHFDVLDFLTLPHLHYFTSNTLKNLLSSHGFSIISSDEQIFQLSKKDEMQNKELTNFYIQNLSYLKKVNNNIFYLKAKYILKRIVINSIKLFLGHNLFLKIKKIVQ